MDNSSNHHHCPFHSRRATVVSTLVNDDGQRMHFFLDVTSSVWWSFRAFRAGLTLCALLLQQSATVTRAMWPKTSISSHWPHRWVSYSKPWTWRLPRHWDSPLSPLSLFNKLWDASFNVEFNSLSLLIMFIHSLILKHPPISFVAHFLLSSLGCALVMMMLSLAFQIKCPTTSLRRSCCDRCHPCQWLAPCT